MLLPPTRPTTIIQYIVSLSIQNPAYYNNTAIIATQRTSQDTQFQCLYLDLCNIDVVLVIDYICSNINVCIQYNNSLKIDNLQYKRQYSKGNKAYRRNIADNRYYSTYTTALRLQSIYMYFRYLSVQLLKSKLTYLLV